MPPAFLIAGTLVGLAWCLTGLVAWGGRPDARTGALMLLVGLAWLASMLQFTSVSLPHTLGLLAGPLYLAVFIHLLLAFPGGRLGERRARLIVIAAYVDTVGGDGTLDALRGGTYVVSGSRVRFSGARVVDDARADGRQRGTRARLRIRGRGVPSARLSVRIKGKVARVTGTVAGGAWRCACPRPRRSRRRPRPSPTSPSRRRWRACRGAARAPRRRRA